jgi:DNA modification methylase
MKTGYITYTTKSPHSLPIPKESVDLVITRLPQPMGTDLPGVDSAPSINMTSEAKYLKDLSKIISEMYRVLKPGGSLVIDVGTLYEIDRSFYQEVAKRSKFNYLGSLYESGYEENNQEEFFSFDSVQTRHILSKGVPYFNPFVTKDYFNPLLQLEDSEEDSSVKDWIAEANPRSSFDISSSLALRIVEILTKPNGIVLDPFGGSGSVAIAASKLGRSAISSDPNSDIIEIAKLRTILSMGEKYFNENVKVVPFE